MLRILLLATCTGIAAAALPANAVGAENRDSNPFSSHGRKSDVLARQLDRVGGLNCNHGGWGVYYVATDGKPASPS